jgi:hypothetical protein
VTTTGMYAPGDPRATSTESSAKNLAAPYRDPQFFPLRDLPAVRVGGAHLWTVRGRNFVVQYLRAEGAAVLQRHQTDEMMMVLATETSAAEVSMAGESARFTGLTVANLPQGSVEMSFDAGTDAILLSTVEGSDVGDTALNADAYVTGDPRIPPFGYWPSSPDVIRAYDVAAAPVDPERFGRIYTSSVGMVNVLNTEGARDPQRLSPHVHDDFEQCSIQIAGDYVHHVRTPWTVRLEDWRPDHHQRLSSPAITIIPAGSVHTSQAVEEGAHQLLDVFCPPRRDWAEKPGWVLNQTDYPLPAELG